MLICNMRDKVKALIHSNVNIHQSVFEAFQYPGLLGEVLITKGFLLEPLALDCDKLHVTMIAVFV
jgi:hypothetical protein